MNLDSICKLVNHDLALVDQTVNEALVSPIPLISSLGKHLIKSGGKRLRPLFVLLGAHALAYSGNYHVALAASLELIHTATLLHDDVVDDSKLRRTQPTANTIWGNAAPILVGDFLYSKAFQLILQTHCWPVLNALAEATHQIAAGEVLQLTQRRNIHLKEADCLKVIQAKTGTLFAAAAMQGALLMDAEDSTVKALSDYGMHFGIAFQLADDALDYHMPHTTLGKNQGDDLAEGKITLPLVYALQHSTPTQAAQIKTTIQEGDSNGLEVILPIIESTKAIDYTYRVAQLHAAQAINYLKTIPDSDYKSAFLALTEFAITRTY